MNPITAEIMWTIPRVGNPLASTRWLVVPVATWDEGVGANITRLWRFEPDGGDPRPLTSPGTTVSGPALSPDGTMLSFVRKVGDRAQIHVMRTDGGEPRVVSDVEGSAVGSTWSPDGRLYAMSNVDGHDEAGIHVTDHALYRYWDRWLTDGSRPHVFEIDTDDWTARDLTVDQDKWMRWENTGNPIADIAVSGDQLVYCAMRPDPPYREPRWSLYSIDLTTGAERELTPWLDGHVSMPRFAPDGELVAGLQFVPDYYADPVRLARIDDQGGHELLDFGGWDRSVGTWDFDGQRLLLTAEDRGTVRLYEWTGGGAPRPLTTGGSVNGFDHADGHIVVSHSSLVTPPEIHRVSRSGLEQVTAFTAEALDGVDLPTVSEITVSGSDSAPIQTYLVAGDGETPLPLVHMIHGGPHGIFGDQWHWRWNAAVFAGSSYTVALVNFAGSTSFGDDFASSIHGAWGDRPAADVEAVTDHLVAEGLVDPDRMAITGGSYGGYLVSWLITMTDRYRCAVAHAAVTDLPAMYASDITMGRARAYGAEAWDDPERVQRWSPMSHAADVVTPTLVIHGDRDYRVPVGQGLELYGMLHAKGVPTRLVHFDDEGHWILDKRRSLRWYEEVTAWLDRFLSR